MSQLSHLNEIIKPASCLSRNTKQMYDHKHQKIPNKKSLEISKDSKYGALGEN